jgi:hypothetical protein
MSNVMSEGCFWVQTKTWCLLPLAVFISDIFCHSGIFPSPGTLSFSYHYSLLHITLTSLWGFFLRPLIIRIKRQNISQQWCHSITQPSCLSLVSNTPRLGSVWITYMTVIWAGFYLQSAQTFKIPFLFFVLILCSLLIDMQTMKMKSTEFYLTSFNCDTRYQYMLDKQGLILGTNRDIAHFQYVCTYSGNHLNVSLNIVDYRSWHEVVNIGTKIQLWKTV